MRNRIPLLSTHYCSVWFARKLIEKLHTSGIGSGSSPKIFLITDLNGKVVDVNPAWSEALGWSADDLIGDTAEWLIHPDDRDRSFREFVKEAERNGAPHFQMRILHKNGSYRLLSWLAVRDREFIYAGARDITGLKQTQEKLEALRNRLAQSSRHTVVDALTASIAHEIKQPLAGIVTNARRRTFAG